MRPAALLLAAWLALPQPTFRSGVDLIEVVAIVRDRDGRLVRDLTAADFQVMEAGTVQSIAAFQRIAIPLPVNPPETPARAAVGDDVGSNERAGDARVFLLVLDALHVSSLRSRVVREQARRFIERHIGPSDLVGVVSPGGLKAGTQDFTTDRARLLAAVDQFAGNKMASASLEIAREAQMHELTLHGGRDPGDGERAGRARALTDTLEAFAGHLGRLESRRKSLILFSEGIDYDTTDVMGTVQRQGSDVMKAMDRALGALMRANVSIYAIDPRMLGSAEGDLAENPIFRATPSLTQGSVEAEYSASIRGLRFLAESTGGFAAADRNDIGPAFDRILEESSDYYLLAYRPSTPAKRGEFRAIDVRVSRPGVRVVARKGYRVPSDPAPVRSLAPSSEAEIPVPPTGRGRNTRMDAPPSEAAVRPAPAGLLPELDVLLASPLPRAGLPIRVQAVPFKGSDRKSAVRLVVEVLGQSLAFAERGGRFEERIDLALLTVDDGGRAGNGRSARIDLRLAPDERQRAKATGVRWLSRIDLEPGRYQLRVAGRALATGASGTVTLDVDVPAFAADRLALSGVTLTSLPSVLMLTRGDPWLQPALETPPSAARSFVAGDQIRAAVEVYVPEQASTDTEITASVDRPDGSHTVPVRRTVARAAGKGRSDAIAFPIDTTPLPPGRYVLHIVLTSPAGGATMERRVPFVVIR